MCQPDGVPEPVVAIDNGAGRRPLLAAATAAIAALLIGAARVSDHSYWLDEAYSANVVNRSWIGLVHVLGKQAAGMFSFHVGLWIWAQPFGQGDAALRMFSVVGGVVTVAVAVWLAVRWFGTAVAVLTVALMLTNPFFLRYLTELRGYSWAMALSIGGVWALDRLFEHDRRRDAITLGVIIGVALANHVLALAALIPLALALWATGMLTVDRLRTHLLAVVVPAVLLVLPAAPPLIKGSDATDWIPGPGFVPVGRETVGFFGGYWFGALLLIGVVGATWHLIEDRHEQREQDWRVAAVVATSLLTLPLMLAMSFVRPMYISRYASPAFPMIVIAAAVGYRSLGRRLEGRVARQSSSAPDLQIGVMAIVFALAVGTFLSDHPLVDEPKGSNPKAAVEFVLERLQPGDLVAVNNFPPPFVRYLGARPEIDPAYRPLDDKTLHNRKRTSEIIDELRSAPVLYLFGWEQIGLDPQLATLAAERDVTIERFGLATVWILASR